MAVTGVISPPQVELWAPYNNTLPETNSSPEAIPKETATYSNPYPFSGAN